MTDRVRSCPTYQISND